VHEPAVKQYAVCCGVPVLQPEKLKEPAFLERLQSYNADLFVVVAFRMLPEEVWKIPPSGTVNLHASLLPQYRGAAPINRAIMNGETQSGTTVFFINSEIDSGNIISYSEVEIGYNDDAGTVHDRLMHSGAAHLAEAVNAIAAGNITTIPQENVPQNQPLQAAPKIFRETCKINWSDDVEQLYNFIRGLSPYPAAWTTLASPKGERMTLKIYKAAVKPDSAPPVAGTIVSDSRTFMHIAAAGGWLEIHSLQLEGNKRMDIADFLRGVHGIEEYRVE
jgi:methionyl-tRNA formyltransferase